MKLKEIKAVINKDANGRGSLNDGKGHMCAQGGLAAAVGLKPQGNHLLSPIERATVINFFELDDNGDAIIQQIPSINDHFTQVDTRRKALIEYFERVEAGEEYIIVTTAIITRHKSNTWTSYHKSNGYRGPYIPWVKI